MKSIVIRVVFILATLTACDTETPIGEESSIQANEDVSIIVEEGATVIVEEGVSVEEQPNQPLSVNRFFQDIGHKRHCSIGDRVIIQATISDDQKNVIVLGPLSIETGDNDVIFIAHADSVYDVLRCWDYFKVGETYELEILISSIRFFKIVGKDHPNFHIEGYVILTKKLEKEIREAGCWKGQ